MQSARRTLTLQRPGTPPANPALAQAQATHATAVAQFDQAEAAMTMLAHVKAGLDQVRKLGDMVTPEDVIEEAGKLVGQGAPAGQIAALLSSMPQAGGVALQAWVSQQEAFVAQKEAELFPAHAVLGHRMAQSALGVMQAGSASAGQAQGQPQPQAQPEVQPDASSLNIQPQAQQQ